jgi:hypothetical protein
MKEEDLDLRMCRPMLLNDKEATGESQYDE